MQIKSMLVPVFLCFSRFDWDMQSIIRKLNGMLTQTSDGCLYLCFVCMHMLLLCDVLIGKGFVMLLCCHLILTHFSTSPLCRFGIFDPAIVYDHLGEIYAALVVGSLVFCIFLYIKVSFSVLTYLCLFIIINFLFLLLSCSVFYF